MIELLWVLLLLSPLFLLALNFYNTSIKQKIVFCAVFYVILYANMGYSLQLLKIPINVFSVFSAIMIIDTLLLYYLLKNNKLENIKNWNYKNIKISKIDIALSIIILFSFFLYYYDQSKSFSLLHPDSWYWFSGSNFIMDNRFLFNENISYDYDVMHWYPDGFHYLWGITFLPFSSTLSYNAVKLIAPLFGVLTLVGLWEYFSEHKSYVILVSIIYFISIPNLIDRFSMFLPESSGIFMIVFTGLVLKKYEFNKNIILIIGVVTGLFTNIYHSTGLIIFFIFGIIVVISKHNLKKYLFYYLLGAIFFFIPFILDPKGFLTYNSHIVEVKVYPSLWNTWIKESGIIFYANPSAKYTAIRAPILGFPLSFMYLSLFFRKRFFDKSILFSLFLLIFSFLLGISYYLYETIFSARSFVIFSISSVLLLPSFIMLMQEIFNKHFKNKSKKILYIFLILLLINRALIFSFTYPSYKNDYIEEKSLMILWIDDNVPIESTIVIEKDFTFGEYPLNIESHVERILYPRETIFGEGNYTINKNTYYLCYDDSLVERGIVHKETGLVLVKLGDN